MPRFGRVGHFLSLEHQIMSKPKGDEKSQNLLSDETDVERQSAKEQADRKSVV